METVGYNDQATGTTKGANSNHQIPNFPCSLFLNFFILNFFISIPLSSVRTIH